MAVPGNGTPRFEVRCSGALIEQIRRVHRKARRQGRAGLVTQAFRKIIDQLERDPFNAGEPAYRLPSLRLQVRRAVIKPLVVDFAVCEDRPLVFLKGVKLLSL